MIDQDHSIMLATPSFVLHGFAWFLIIGIHAILFRCVCVKENNPCNFGGSDFPLLIQECYWIYDTNGFTFSIDKWGVSCVTCEAWTP